MEMGILFQVRVLLTPLLLSAELFAHQFANWCTRNSFAGVSNAGQCWTFFYWVLKPSKERLLKSFE